MDRCTHLRTPTTNLPLSSFMKNEILRKVASYATGRETLRCLALATVDSPPSAADFELGDADRFKDYEVDVSSFLLSSVTQCIGHLKLYIAKYPYLGLVFKISK